MAMQELWEVISGIVSIPPPALCSLRLAPLILLCPTTGTRTDTHFDGNRVNQALAVEYGPKRRAVGLWTREKRPQSQPR